MNLDLSNFKKLHESKNLATFSHPDGHQIIVDKTKIKPNQKKQLGKLKTNFYDGEQVGQPQDEDLDLNALTTPEEPSQVSDTGNASRAPSEDEIIEEKQKNAYDQYGNVNPERDVLLMNSNDPTVLNSQAKILGRQNEAAEDSQYQEASDWKAQVAAVQAYNEQAKKMGMPTKPIPEAPKEPAPINQNPQLIETPNAPSAPSAPVKKTGGGGGYLGGSELGEYRKSAQQYEQGLKDQASVEGQLGQQRAIEIQKGIEQKQNALQMYQERETHNLDQADKFMQDYKNQHIDPDHYLSSLNTGQKIATGIGLLLGGMSWRGGSNPVMDHLDKTIQNDVEAQKSEMGKKENLLTANFRQFGNIDQAAKMTYAQQSAIVADKLDMEAAKLADPMAQAKLKQSANEFRMKTVQTIKSLSLQQTMMDQLNSQSAPASSADKAGKLIDSLRITNPELAKSYAARYVPGVGLSKIDIPDKGRDDFSMNDEYKDLIDRSIKFQKSLPGNRAAVTPDQVAEANVLKQEFDELGTRAQGINRLNTEEIKLAEKAFNPGGWQYANPLAGLNALKKATDNRRNILLRKYDFPVPYKPSSEKGYEGK